jgi:hypothetical protein
MLRPPPPSSSWLHRTLLPMLQLLVLGERGRRRLCSASFATFSVLTRRPLRQDIWLPLALLCPPCRACYLLATPPFVCDALFHPTARLGQSQTRRGRCLLRAALRQAPMTAESERYPRSPVREKEQLLAAGAARALPPFEQLRTLHRLVTDCVNSFPCHPVAPSRSCTSPASPTTKRSIFAILGRHQINLARTAIAAGRT